MRRLLLAAALLTLAACAKTKEDPPRAWLWRVSDFVSDPEQASGARELGGFRAEEFITQGLENAWATGMLPEAGDNRIDSSLPVLNAMPGLAGGRNVAFTVTEVWQDAPAPWVDPVYVVRQDQPDGRSTKVEGVVSVFGVRWQSTFYSPYWQLQFPSLYPNTPVPAPTTVREMVALGGTDGGIADGAFVLCPFVPKDTTIASVRPFTGEALGDHGTAPKGFADGDTIWYFDFGPDTFRATPRGVISRGFLYVFSVGAKALLPHVLPNDPQLTLLQRVEVDPTGFGVALPAQFGALIEELGTQGMTVHVMDGGVPLAYAGHVVKNPDCFEAGFPGSCLFLDSEAAVRALPTERLTETTVLVTAPRLAFADGGTP